MSNLKKFVKDHSKTIIVTSAVVVTGATILIAKHKLGLAKTELAFEQEKFDALFHAFSETDDLARNAGVSVESLNAVLNKFGFAVLDMNAV